VNLFLPQLFFQGGFSLSEKQAVQIQRIAQKAGIVGGNAGNGKKTTSTFMVDFFNNKPV
jgi:hypothetical protein